MHPRLSRSVALLAALFVATAIAAPVPAAVRAEIEALLKALQASGCQFNRNGSWYTGAEAQAHLGKKLEYLEKKDLVKSTEDFINLGASASSSSNKPYLVRCGATQPIESKVWLHTQLTALRQAK